MAEIIWSDKSVTDLELIHAYIVMPQSELDFQAA